ncbi:hypothetical protein [Pseudonocardia lacus]|jgi:hypothetical protein|uniref:hypothetical protein n=1 Tax=Pseudonocardia lacus TaxID=2835865 RepID=UPI001BDC1806|nr:hypothetical protein [Pseudonocardia lacus]
MTRLLDRLAQGRGGVFRLADRIADRVMPQEVTASGSCWWVCTGPACNSYQGWWGTRQLEYCSGGYWSGDSRCSWDC